MTVTATPSAMASLADRLTNTQDRETYSALMCYLNRLPPGDEFRQLAELLGLLSLVGQRIPDALADFLVQFRAQTKVSAEYQGQVEARLADLPREIVAGVDASGIAKAMSESFRQQLAVSGLQDTAALLKAAVITLKSLSGDVTNTLKPVSAILSEEATTLLATTRQLEQQNTKLFQQQQRATSWILFCVVGIVMFLFGVLYGEVLEKRLASDAISNIAAELKDVCRGVGAAKAR